MRIRFLFLCFLLMFPGQSRAITVQDAARSAVDCAWNYPLQTFIACEVLCLVGLYIRAKLADALFYACKKNNTNKALLLLWLGVNPNNAIYNFAGYGQLGIGRNPLEISTAMHYACYHGNKELLMALLKRGGFINVVTRDCEMTPLCFAAKTIDGLKIVGDIIREGGAPFYNYDSIGFPQEELLRDLSNLFLNPIDSLSLDDYEKTCRDIGLLFSFTKKDFKGFYNQREDSGYISNVKHNKTFKCQSFRLMSMLDIQLIQVFRENCFPEEIIFMFMNERLQDKTDNLLSHIQLFQRSENKDDVDEFKPTLVLSGAKDDKKLFQLKSALKTKIIADAEKQLRNFYQCLVQREEALKLLV